jgi:alpha-ketoglutarate-dependent taurine dioxygenase
VRDYKISASQAEKLSQIGWVKVTTPEFLDLDRCLVKIAMTLGEPKRLRNSSEIVQKLAPTLASNAHPNSLSAQYSFGNFPMHMDTAHWSSPCRYVILGCSNVASGERRTRLLDFRSLSISESERALLYSTPFRVVNGRHSFYSNVLSSQREFIRYDPGCMAPTCSSGTQVFKVFSEERWNNQIEEIKWKPGTVLIIDNWRVLHGRGCASQDDGDRLLHRVLVA